ncbi:MAG: hypothetical protein K940chlam3_00341 [Chlamydiae bacterium]|nr:hypothetical protein [Chlamydiota bacterium]
MRKSIQAIFALFLMFSSDSEASYVYYPYCESGFFFDAGVEGIYVEEPDIGFYGLVTPDDTPAVIYDPSCLTARVSGSVGYTFFPTGMCRCFGENVQFFVTSSFFTCSQRGKKDLTDLGPVQLFAINGGGVGNALEVSQVNNFHSCHWENHTDAMISGISDLCYGFSLHTAVGFGFIYRCQQFKSNLFNESISYNNGTITENLDTYYRGVKVEFGISKRFCDCWLVTMVPTFGIYDACTNLCAHQDWGQLADGINGLDPVSQSEKLSLTAYQGAFRSSFLRDWCGYYVGGQVFVEYLSYVPGLFNPREDDDGPTRIVEKNSFRYGGGFVIGKIF